MAQLGKVMGMVQDKLAQGREQHSTSLAPSEPCSVCRVSGRWGKALPLHLINPHRVTSPPVLHPQNIFTSFILSPHLF